LTPAVGAGRRLALAGGAAAAAAAAWWRLNPSACPYSQRFWVEAPHPFITRERLREVLDPRPGERLLEIGPGTGYYTLPVAGWLGAEGRLDVLDLQQEMLDHTMRAAGEQGVTGIEPALADARELPYENASFDGAYLVTVLGEIPDQVGRVVVGELFGDPHMVTRSALGRRAESAWLRVDRTLGGALWHFTRLARD
jgi:SAM-dependent methyltransferase